MSALETCRQHGLRVASAITDPTASSHHAARKTLSEPCPMHLLYVEDDPIIRELTTEVLQGAGLTVEAASCGVEACSAFSRAAAAGRPHDVVLLDLHLPDMNGWDVAKHVKVHPAGATVKVFLLTASTVAAAASPHAGVEIAGTILKPVTPKQLIDLLR